MIKPWLMTKCGWEMETEMSSVQRFPIILDNFVLFTFYIGQSLIEMEWKLK